MTPSSGTTAFRHRIHEYAGMMAAHDLKQPLTSIQLTLRLMQRLPVGSAVAQRAELLNDAVWLVERMGRMVDGFLQIAKVHAAPPVIQRVPLEIPIRDSLRALQALIDQTAGTIRWDDLPVVKADPLLLAEVFQNLIGNAMLYHSERPCTVDILAEGTGNDWLIGVGDNGVGFDPSQASQIFEAFTRGGEAKEANGAGLGLAICKLIVEHHGGRIWAESQPGVGSTFWFTLPD